MKPRITRCRDTRHLTDTDWRILTAMRITGWACPTCQAGPPTWVEKVKKGA